MNIVKARHFQKLISAVQCNGRWERPKVIAAVVVMLYLPQPQRSLSLSLCRGGRRKGGGWCLQIHSDDKSCPFPSHVPTHPPPSSSHTRSPSLPSWVVLWVSGIGGEGKGGIEVFLFLPFSPYHVFPPRLTYSGRGRRELQGAREPPFPPSSSAIISGQLTPPLPPRPLTSPSSSSLLSMYVVALSDTKMPYQ